MHAWARYGSSGPSIGRTSRDLKAAPVVPLGNARLPLRAGTAALQDVSSPSKPDRMEAASTFAPIALSSACTCHKQIVCQGHILTGGGNISEVEAEQLQLQASGGKLPHCRRLNTALPIEARGCAMRVAESCTLLKRVDKRTTMVCRMHFSRLRMATRKSPDGTAASSCTAAVRNLCATRTATWV